MIEISIILCLVYLLIYGLDHYSLITMEHITPHWLCIFCLVEKIKEEFL